jgi:hypothetical protein
MILKRIAGGWQGRPYLEVVKMFEEIFEKQFGKECLKKDENLYEPVIFGLSAFRFDLEKM